MRLDAGERSFVARFSLDEPPRALHVPPGYSRLTLAVVHHGAVLKVLDLPARRRYDPDELWAALPVPLHAHVVRRGLRAAVEEAVGATDGDVAGAPSVSVVVCTRDRPEQLALCLESLLALDPSAHEVLVVDNAPSDDRARDLCARLPVRYVVEPDPGQARARNRGVLETTGALVAFTDDDCVVDPGWLAGIGRAFRDTLVMAATGFIGPLELEHPAQVLFERTMRPHRWPDRRVFDPLHDSPVTAAVQAGAGANMIFRREAFDCVGPFAEDLGPGTAARSADDAYAFYRVLARGFRIDYDPRRIVWHRHRAGAEDLEQIVADYGLSHFAYATRCLFRHGEPASAVVAAWWVRNWVRDLGRAALRSARRTPLSLTWRQVRGAAQAPLALVRSSRGRRGLPALAPRTAAANATPPLEKSRGSVVVASPELPALSVAIASRNRRDQLGKTLRALGSQTLDGEDFEVVVVLDGSSDDSAEMAQAMELPYELRVVAREQRGLAATRNDGARAARNPVVVFLDDDIVPEPQFLVEHARGHAGPRRDVFLMGHFPPARSGTGLFEMLVRSWWEDHFRHKAQAGHRWSFSDVVDGNASMSRALFDRLGGFDESFLGGRRQDWELGVRMLKAGVPLAYRPEARGAHEFEIDLAVGLRNQREEGHNDVLIVRRHPGAKWELPFHRFRLAPGAIHVSRRVRFEHPRGAARHVALTAATALERLHLRRTWLHLIAFLLDTAYLTGARDALRGGTTLREFLTVDPGESSHEELVVPLGGVPSPSPAAGPAPAEVVVRVGDLRVARVHGLNRDGQWDADELVARIVDQAAPALESAAMLEALGGGPG